MQFPPQFLSCCQSELFFLHGMAAAWGLFIYNLITDVCYREVNKNKNQMWMMMMRFHSENLARRHPPIKLTNIDTSFYHYIPQLNPMFSPDLHKQSHCSLNANHGFLEPLHQPLHGSALRCHKLLLDLTSPLRGHNLNAGTILLFDLDFRHEFQRFLQAIVLVVHRLPCRLISSLLPWPLLPRRWIRFNPLFIPISASSNDVPNRR